MGKYGWGEDKVLMGTEETVVITVGSGELGDVGVSQRVGGIRA